MILGHQPDHFGAGQDYGTVSVCGIRTYRAIVIEGRVKCHTCSDTGAVHHSVFTYHSCYRVPGEACRRTVCEGVNPALVDAVGETIGIYGCRRGLRSEEHTSELQSP